MDGSNPDGSEARSLGRRPLMNFVPLEEIKIQEKSRFTGIAELICESIETGDMGTAKDYWKQARYENPDVANTVFYDNFASRISDSYFGLANSNMDSVDWTIDYSDTIIQTIEIAINNAVHYSPSHPLREISEARLLIMKANLITQYDYEKCLSEAKSKISRSNNIGEDTLRKFSVDIEMYKMYRDRANEDYDRIEKAIKRMNNSAEGILTVIVAFCIVAFCLLLIW